MHDCDETFNFWEPLHYLLYGAGLQTWEHSPRYALRSALYLGAHRVVATPFAAILGDADHRRVFVFYATRVVLGLASALVDAHLCAATRRAAVAGGEADARIARALAALLAFSAGPFVASTAFLPSSFAGAGVAFAAASALDGAHGRACVACSLAVTLGWPFAGVAALSFGLVAWREIGFAKTFVAAVAPAAMVATASRAADSTFYGKPTWSVMNIVRYNVFTGGGNGAELYGTEPWWYYARTLVNAFSVAAPLSLVAPACALAAAIVGGRGASATATATTRARVKILTRAYAPFPIALAFFSALPHKEERFMYVAHAPLLVGAATAACCVGDVAGYAARRAFAFAFALARGGRGRGRGRGLLRFEALARDGATLAIVIFVAAAGGRAGRRAEGRVRRADARLRGASASRDERNVARRGRKSRRLRRRRVASVPVVVPPPVARARAQVPPERVRRRAPGAVRASARRPRARAAGAQRQERVRRGVESPRRG